jgi:hypothetical protein
MNQTQSSYVLGGNMSIENQIIGAINGFPVDADAGEMQPDINPWTRKAVTPTNPWLHKGTVLNDEDETAILSASRAAIEKAVFPQKESTGSSHIATIFARAAESGNYDGIAAELEAANALGELAKMPVTATRRPAGGGFDWNETINTARTAPKAEGKHELAENSWSEARAKEIEGAVEAIDAMGDDESWDDFCVRLNSELKWRGHKEIPNEKSSEKVASDKRESLLNLAARALEEAKRS